MEQLSIADLISLKNLIDAACTRGAFKAGEMRSVGEVYDKLSAFINAAELQQAATQDQIQGET